MVPADAIVKLARWPEDGARFRERSWVGTRRGPADAIGRGGAKLRIGRQGTAAHQRLVRQARDRGRSDGPHGSHTQGQAQAHTQSQSSASSKAHVILLLVRPRLCLTAPAIPPYTPSRGSSRVTP